MSPSLIVTGSLELQADRLAERIATRVVELLHEAARTATAAGSEVYEREQDPDPGGGRHGARFGGVLNDTGELEHDERPTG